ncbi:MAG: exodeoxyribonuclease small subunit [Pseudomonadota bacterium]|jgi:exodeoxyribonuclease VII small subunit
MTTPVAELSYEAALEELEALVRQLEEGKLPLDQMLVDYQRGNELLQRCQAKLQAVQDQIRVLAPEQGQA